MPAIVLPSVAVPAAVVPIAVGRGRSIDVSEGEVVRVIDGEPRRRNAHARLPAHEHAHLPRILSVHPRLEFAPEEGGRRVALRLGLRLGLVRGRSVGRGAVGCGCGEARVPGALWHVRGCVRVERVGVGGARGEREAGPVLALLLRPRRALRLRIRNVRRKRNLRKRDCRPVLLLLLLGAVPLLDILARV